MYVNICVSIGMQNLSVPSSVCIAAAHFILEDWVHAEVWVDESDAHKIVDEGK